MKVNFAPETEMLIAERAAKAGTTAEALVMQTVTAWLAQTPEGAEKVLPRRHLAGGIITPQ